MAVSHRAGVIEELHDFYGEIMLHVSDANWDRISRRAYRRRWLRDGREVR